MLRRSILFLKSFIFAAEKDFSKGLEIDPQSTQKITRQETNYSPISILDVIYFICSFCDLKSKWLIFFKYIISVVLFDYVMALDSRKHKTDIWFSGSSKPQFPQEKFKVRRSPCLPTVITRSSVSYVVPELPIHVISQPRRSHISSYIFQIWNRENFQVETLADRKISSCLTAFNVLPDLC